MRVSKSTLLKKLELSEKFPRNILCTKKSQLGVEIIKPSAIITVLALKLHLGYRRNEDEIAQQIGINERNTSFQHGCNKNII